MSTCDGDRYDEAMHSARGLGVAMLLTVLLLVLSVAVGAAWAVLGRW